MRHREVVPGDEFVESIDQLNDFNSVLFEEGVLAEFVFKSCKVLTKFRVLEGFGREVLAERRTNVEALIGDVFNLLF